jgi:hypothetical protein
MNRILPRLGFCAAAAAAFCALAISASARSEQWKNAKGETFEAEPSDIIGPWALFDDSTLVPLATLTDEDCVRFQKGLKDQPARAGDWKNATSKVSSELFGRLMHYEGDSNSHALTADDETGRPEPEFFIIFYTTSDKNHSWDLLRRSTPALYAKLDRDYPGLVQGVVFGVGENSAQDHYDNAVNTKGEWMYALFADENKMRTLQHRIPTNLYGIVVMTRDGVVLFAPPDSTTDEQVKDAFDKFSAMLSHMRPTDTKVWAARAHYFRAVQPVEFAGGKCDPLLMGNPLVESTLRAMNIFQVDATFQVAADGRIMSVEVKSAEMTKSQLKQFEDGFRRGCLFVPAVDHGKFVDGTYHYHMEVPRQ